MPLLKQGPPESENGGPQGGVDMQSAHAGACFVRVGRCGLDSILGSVLGAQFATIPFFGRPGVLGWVLLAGLDFDDF